MTILRPSKSLLRRSAAVALVLAVCSVGLRPKVKAEDIPTGITTKRVTPPAEQYRLRMFHTHTGESIDVVYKVGAEFVPSGLDKLNHFLRDHRTDDASEYDPKEFDLLRCLVVNGNKAVPHRKLLQAVWGPDYGDEVEYLRVFINALRKKVEPNPSKPKYLMTEPWVGYRFAVPEADITKS